MGMKINRWLPLPAELKERLPMSAAAAAIKAERDEKIKSVFTGKSSGFIVIVGPCSADNEDAVCEYVARLARVNERVKDKLCLIPRI